MNRDRFQRELSSLISARSLPGEETPALLVMESILEDRGWRIERMPVSDSRWNIFVPFGEPKTLLTTHLDVVPGPDKLFSPRLEDGFIFGRGACDAKGVALAMIYAAEEAERSGLSDIALLFVVGEEDDGIGARRAADSLSNRGIKYLVNGEPTECRLMRGHKGLVEVHLTCNGKSAHSGYPELGTDANRILIEILNDFDKHHWPVDELLGQTLYNYGVLKGGVASNVVSPQAQASIMFRTVSSASELISEVRDLIGARAEVSIRLSSDPVRCITLDGFETGIAAFATDISNFSKLGASAILYGPGSILCAHSDEERLALVDAEDGINGYLEIIKQLHARIG